MKNKHNKKRNTAFLFESLIREVTKATLKKDTNRRNNTIAILKEFYSKNKILAAELKLFKTLEESSQKTPDIATRILNEAKIRHKSLDKRLIFNEQTSLIKKINKTLGNNVFENFVPNYKSLATIYQVLYENVDIEKQIKLEEQILDKLQQSQELLEEQKYKPISKLAFKTFHNKFNETYDKGLLKEQKELINHYVTSFEHDDLELKIFLNEEIDRLRASIKSMAEKAIVAEKKEQLINVLGSFSKKEIDKNMIEKVLKIQQLTKEINDNGN